MIDFDVENLVGKFAPLLHREQVRSFLGVWAESFGRGGIEKAHKITGVSRKTISRGIEECKNLERAP